jgi:hypothetical protein
MMVDDVKSLELKQVTTIRELRELIVALDRRLPRVERVGEIDIARAASGLKIEALRRIEELEREMAAAATA